MELILNNVTKSYGTKTALCDLSCTLTPGVYGLLGPNGAGKSTLMNLLSGNLEPNEGEILWAGQPLKKIRRSVQWKLGYAPQQQPLYPSFTAVRFLAYMAALQGLDRTQAQQRIPWSLKKVGLSSVANHKISTYSGGMKQRLVIAQAILSDSELLILDEPTAGLDPRQRIAIRNLIAEIAAEKIVLIATHVVSDVEFIAKEFILLKEGELLCRGSRDELIEQLAGKVFELHIPQARWNVNVPNHYLVSNMLFDQGYYLVRVIAEETPQDWQAEPVRPTLEDVYLWHFGESIDEFHETAGI